MNSLETSLFFFVTIMIELTLLFLGTSALIGLVLQYLPEEKLRRWLGFTGARGNVLGAAIGGITPFCACSTIPMTVGFLKARIPFGSVMSFLIASPILNPVVMTMLLALFGLRSAAIYAGVTFLAAVAFGIALERLDFSKYVKSVRVSGGKTEAPAAEGFRAKFAAACRSAWTDFKGLFVFMLIGVAIGAVIKGYIPQDLVVRLAGPQNPLAIPVAALIGIPLYVRASTAIPIGLALMQKGMSEGAVIALIIGGAGMAIPEMSMLASIFRPKLVGAVVGVIFVTAVTAGMAFNLM
jgi:uncharacterized membrane protein YraQ (UPF0718 family)